MHADYNYSVLMSVYAKESADNLTIAMNSIWEQTKKTNDFVLVCDGKLNEELDAVVEKMEKIHPELHVIRLDKNSGLGNALNIGMKMCANELIARMDSDDISRPDRCEKQVKMFEKFPKLSIVSGTVEEFSVSIDRIDAIRNLPENSNEIFEFAKKRNPFNHPCVMYKKSAVEQAGGYKPFYLLEDYFLWIRMLQHGALAYNFRDPLLWMRAGSEMYKRRSGWKYAKSQKALFSYMRETHFISNTQYLKSVISRFIVSLVPNEIRRFAFKRLLRDA